LPTADCAPALDAVLTTGGLPAPAPMPPVSVLVVSMDDCAAIPNPPPSVDLCAALEVPVNVQLVGLADVTYRNDYGRAFMWLVQALTFASPQVATGPLSAIVIGRFPIPSPTPPPPVASPSVRPPNRPSIRRSGRSR
jgi:hypothetical protein